MGLNQTHSLTPDWVEVKEAVWLGQTVFQVKEPGTGSYIFSAFVFQDGYPLFLIVNMG